MRWPLLLTPVLVTAACAPAPPRSPQPPSQVALPSPGRAQSQFFVTSDGVRLHYTDAGQGTAIVFVPGWDMPGWIFQLQEQDLSRTNRVILFDPRGQGSSDIAAHGYEPHRRGQDLTELLAHLNAGPVVLVGWSLGVLDCLAAIADHGDRPIAGLVLIDNSVGEAPAPPLPKPAGTLRRRAKPVTRAQAMHSFVAGMFATHQPAEYLQQLTDAALRVPAAASAALLAYPMPRSFWYNAVYSTHKPILYVVRTGLAGQARNLQANHMDTASVVLPHVGHALFVDDPNTFDALVRAFLRRHGL